MRGKVSRAIRKEVYHNDMSPRYRQYKYTSGVKTIKRVDRDASGAKVKDKNGKYLIVSRKQRYHTLSAGDFRRTYQTRKKVHRMKG